MQHIPKVSNGKLPNEPYNVNLGCWLPADTPYGNFSLKLMKISSRIDRINLHIQDAYRAWNAITADLPRMILPAVFDQQVYSMEEAVYNMRRICDELISLVWCLSEWEIKNEWPKKIGKDCIGVALNGSRDDSAVNKVFSPHYELLKTLNNVSNAFKHSFINTDHTLIGKNEPCIHALGLERNELAFKPKFYNVSISQLVNDFDKMYQDAFSWVKVFSSKNQSE